MNPITCRLLLCAWLLLFSACSQMPDMPNLFWDTEDAQHEPDTVSPGRNAEPQPALTDGVSAELRTDRQLPMAEQIGKAAIAGKLPQQYRTLLGDDAITVDARSYGRTVAELFSAVIDAMTSLNIPIESVDSPNGVITSGWIGKGENDLTMPGIKAYTRHRFIIYIYRSGGKSGDMSRMEVRVPGQLYEKRRCRTNRFRAICPGSCFWLWMSYCREPGKQYSPLKAQTNCSSQCIS